MMIYRKLGRTGLRVSQLGFGCMRLPMCGEAPNQRVDRDLAIPMIHRALEAGVNYVDTAVGYCNQDSQRALGEALKAWRAHPKGAKGARRKIVVSTKNPCYGEDEKEWWTNLENSLQRLQVDCIDIYNQHGISWKAYEESVAPRVGKWMLKARDQGLIRHICCSFHDGNEALIKLIDSGWPESITLQYNILYRALEEGIAYAHAKGVGVVVMGPVGGGRLGAPNEVLAGLLPQVRRVPELALRFVLSNPNVCVALSGMSTMAQVQENIATAADKGSLSGDDKAAILEHLERLKHMADLYCTGCGYCMPCPEEVNIPGVFGAYNQARVYGFWGQSRRQYGAMVRREGQNGRAADACIECGKCEEKCPQHIAIREQLKEAHAALTGDKQ